MLKNKYKVEILPITDEFIREKRLIQDRGELVLLSDGEEIRHITFFTLNPGNGHFRGVHYHKKKVEKFYLVSGKAWLFLADVESHKTEKIEVEAGQRVTVYPACAHKFVAITPIQVIEYYSTAFDTNDEFSFSDFDGD